MTLQLVSPTQNVRVFESADFNELRFCVRISYFNIMALKAAWFKDEVFRPSVYIWNLEVVGNTLKMKMLIRFLQDFFDQTAL